MLARNIFVVSAWIVDSTGAFHILDSYPKAFDSKSYQNDIDKALKRAKGEYHSTIGTLCSRDDRQVQTVTLTDIYGNLLEPPFTIGELAEVQEEQNAN